MRNLRLFIALIFALNYLKFRTYVSTIFIDPKEQQGNQFHKSNHVTQTKLANGPNSSQSKL